VLTLGYCNPGKLAILPEIGLKFSKHPDHLKEGFPGGPLLWSAKINRLNDQQHAPSPPWWGSVSC
jgi:hypothetical protein